MYIGHDFCDLVIEILFIVFGYIDLERLVINFMFLNKYIYFNYSYQYSILIVSPVTFILIFTQYTYKSSQIGCVDDI